jgi:periplasmic divalent cation tolerance protein
MRFALGRLSAETTRERQYNISVKSHKPQSRYRKAVTEIVIVLTTAPADDRAEQLAHQLVDERLAACATVSAPMVSVYRWQGRIDREAERQIVIKTTRDRLAALEARLRQLHSYELPEFLVLAVEQGSAAYLGWVVEQTRQL